MTRRRSVSNPISFRLAAKILDVLDELAQADLPAMPYYGVKSTKKPISKRWVIETCVRHFLFNFLSVAISERQLESNLYSRDQLCNLFLMYCKAQRGEKGYGFTTKNPKTRFVYGPPSDKIDPKIWTNLEKIHNLKEKVLQEARPRKNAKTKDVKDNNGQ